MSTSAISMGTSASSIENEPEQKASFFNSKHLFLIPSITAVALGIICIPNFGLGVLVGTIDVAVKLVGILAWDAIRGGSEESNSSYVSELQETLLVTSVFGPIAEEGIFRGIVQPLLTRGIQIIVPAAAAVAFGPFSIATTVSIVASGIFFGAVHYFNDHEGAGMQAVIASVTGIVYGILSTQFGIGASIAAHITNNSIASIFLATQPRSEHSIEFATPA